MTAEGWRVTRFAWGRRYELGAVTVDALDADEGAAVASVEVTFARVLPLAEAVRATAGVAELVRGLEVKP